MNKKILQVFSALVVVLIIAIGFYFSRPSFLQKSNGKPTLVFLSYSSFNSLSGPGKALKEEFEKTCNCTIRIITVPEAGLLIKKLSHFEQVDLVIGLDQFSIHRAPRLNDWILPDRVKMYKVLPELVGYAPLTFVPFDWSFLTFLYRNSESGKVISEINSLEEFLNSGLDKKLSLQNPRTSTPGMQFLWWIYNQGGLDKLRENLKKLKPIVHSISPSWSTSYGLFQSKKVAMTFSYWTSLHYHWQEEKDKDYRGFEKAEPYPFQIEFVGIPKICVHCDLAQDFVNFMLEKTSQEIISQRNYMLPVTMTRQTKKLISVSDYKKFLGDIENSLEVWDEVFKGD